MAKISAYPDGGAIQDTDQFVSRRASSNFSNLWSTFKSTLKTYFDTLYSPIGSGGDGWTAGTGTWSYSSADAPTFVISINADMTAIIGVGDRIKLTQTTAKYFIVTAVGSFSGGATLITVYGGTDYTLANAAITSPYYSHVKNPFGFPADPAKWTVTVTDTGDRSQATPVNGTWYNLNSDLISVPIGAWHIQFAAIISGQSNAAQTLANVHATLSTANNTESDNKMSVIAYVAGASGTIVCLNSVYKRRPLTVASKTSYYLNLKTSTANMASINTWGSTYSTTVIEAICAYL